MAAAKSSLPTPIPKVPHKVLQERDLNQSIIIVGDIHGCLEELRDLLCKCNYDPITCTAILVGDLVNKGPHSVEVVKFVRSENIHCVRGNHDDTALSHALGTNVKEKSDAYKYVEDFTRYGTMHSSK